MLTELSETCSMLLSYLPTGIALVLAITYCILWGQFLITLCVAFFHQYRKPCLDGPNGTRRTFPGVSIVKPLMGVDGCLEENLESHFQLKYEGPFELLFCVEDPTDPALDLVEKLHKRYPHVECRIFKGPTQSIVNPMVRNMVQGYDAAKFDLIWICSSRVKG